ncbi:hypothetical protein FJZ53_06475, partial [Candidatus Woesearchaeota archaeon]|nr:hypothetical protein [Candidatus Woesearchaeota archaeon]
MKNRPVKEELILKCSVSGNFDIIEKEYYLKVFSDLYDREQDYSLGFLDKKEGLEEAKHFARKYQDLVEAGFYPPNTQFLIARDDLDVLTVMALMPKLDFPEWYPKLEERISGLRKKASKVLGVDESELSGDTALPENYGMIDGEVYCFDLHVL